MLIKVNCYASAYSFVRDGVPIVRDDMPCFCILEATSVEDACIFIEKQSQRWLVFNVVMGFAPDIETVHHIEPLYDAFTVIDEKDPSYIAWLEYGLDPITTEGVPVDE
jgi:hypothetical protein